MNLRQLEYFVSVAETSSFTKTADKFFISQTAVTQQIKSLEEQLDVILLRRTKRHVELTPAGAVFLGEAKAILTRTENAIIKAKKAATGFIGSLNLGIVEGYDNPRMPDLLRTFRTAYPNVLLAIHEASVGSLYTALVNHQLDIVINARFIHSHLEENEISFIVMGNYQLIALLPTTHPLAFKNSLNLAELKDDSFIITSSNESDDSFGHLESTMNHSLRAGFTPDIVQYSNSFNTTALMVAANMGVAILPSYALASSRNLGNLVTIPLTEDSDILEVVAARHNQNGNPVIEKFMSYI